MYKKRGLRIKSTIKNVWFVPTHSTDAVSKSWFKELFGQNEGILFEGEKGRCKNKIV